MTLAPLTRRFAADERGATIIEFGLLAPAFIAMLLGVLQVGIGLQNYNALRDVSADVARHAMIEYARGNRLTPDEIRAYAVSAGTGAPYLLQSARLDTLATKVETAGTQRVTGATELTLTLTYRIPSLLSTIGIEGPQIDYARPIFLTQ